MSPSKAYWEEEEQFVQLALGEEIGEVAHGVGPKSCDVCKFARLLSPQGSNSFYDIVGDLKRHTRTSPLISLQEAAEQRHIRHVLAGWLKLGSISYFCFLFHHSLAKVDNNDSVQAFQLIVGQVPTRCA